MYTNRTENLRIRSLKHSIDLKLHIYLLCMIFYICIWNMIITLIIIDELSSYVLYLYYHTLTMMPMQYMCIIYMVRSFRYNIHR